MEPAWASPEVSHVPILYTSRIQALIQASAILQYLVRHYDPEHKFSFTSPAEVARQEQWIAFMQGDVTPNGVNNVRFFRFLPKKHDFSIALFHREGLKMLEILNNALEGREYLVGEGKGRYSVADIANFAFVNNSHFTGLGCRLFLTSFTIRLAPSSCR